MPCRACGVERRDHTDDGSHKSQHGRKGDEQADPRKTRLHLAGLNRTVGNDGFLDGVETLVVTVETLIVDRSDRTAGVAANFLGSLDAAVLERLLDGCDEFLRVDRRKRQVQNTLDGHGQTDHQAEEHRKHPLPTAFEELLHHNVVHAVACDLGFSDNRFGCGSGILCERTNGTQYGQGSRRNQKKFFHSCVG